MKGLTHPPSKKDLIEAYAELIKLSRTENDLFDLVRFSLLSQWVRFDPRLGELWLTAFHSQWKKLSPFALNHEILKQPWPSVLGVLLSQYELLFLSKTERRTFKTWSKLALYEVKPVPYQNFFIGLSHFRPTSDEEPFFCPMIFYEKYGYFGNEIFFNKASQRIKECKPLLYSVEVRRRALRNLIKQKKRITVKDYLAALHQGVHKRIAEKDLANASFLTGIGNTRSRFYVPKNNR